MKVETSTHNVQLGTDEIAVKDKEETKKEGGSVAEGHKTGEEISEKAKSAFKFESALTGQARAADLHSALGAQNLTNAMGSGPPDARTEGGREEGSKAIDDKLSYKWNDWAVTDKDVKDVHDTMETLPPKEYAAQMDEMKKSGKLGRYIDNMDAKQKEAFLEQAHRKGYIQAEEAKTPEGALNPPKGPMLYKNDPALPKEMREAIHEQNREEVKKYEKEYKEYSERYCEKLEKCKTGEDVRKLGRPAGPADVLKQPGIDNPNDEFAKRWADDQQDESNLPVYRNNIRNATARKMEEITGRKHPGDVSVEVEVTTPGGYKGSVNVGSESGVEGNVGKEVEFHHERGKLSVDKDGKVELGAKSPVKGDKRGLSVKSDGTVEVDTKEGGVASYNPEDKEMRAGFQAGGEKGGVKGTVGVVGIKPEDAEKAVGRTKTTWYDDPPELKNGREWNQLPPETQKEYKEYYGWTEKEWNSKRQEYQK